MSPRIALARIEVFRNFAAAEPLWNQLTTTDALTTPYQRFEWAAQWYRHVGVARKASPLIIVGFDDGDKPHFLLPLILERRYGAGIAAYLFGTLTMADAMYAPVVTRFLTYDVQLDGDCASYCKRIMALPEMIEWCKAAMVEPDELEELEMEF